jgi:hypothetical protein
VDLGGDGGNGVEGNEKVGDGEDEAGGRRERIRWGNKER